VYQEYLAKSLTDKYASLSSHMDKIIHDAKAEIAVLRENVANAQAAYKALEAKHEDLAKRYRNKSKAHAIIHSNYMKLKAQALSSSVASAASHNAERTLQTATASTFTDKYDNAIEGYMDPHIQSSSRNMNIRGVGQPYNHERTGQCYGDHRESKPSHAQLPDVWNIESAGSRIYSSCESDYPIKNMQLILLASKYASQHTIPSTAAPSASATRLQCDYSLRRWC
jgi:E3 ubiquitin-protein ligase CCNP1IP1